MKKFGLTLLLILTSNIYSETINGHTLPPEPDPKINNSTLLGIDSNNNGVRDDVERWIFITYKDKHPIYVDIALQAGRAWNKVLEDPTKAKEIHSYVKAPQYCNWYYQVDVQDFGKTPLITERLDSKVRSKVLNTYNRKEAYIQYDTLLSGDSYTLPRRSQRKELCDFNTAQYEE
jgi:hypothetical protein